MNKLTKIGLNAMVAFTMMFATTVVVAQEKGVVADNVEVKESVEVLPKLAIKKAHHIGPVNTNTKATLVRYTGGYTDWRNINNWEPGGSSTACGGTLRPCEVDLDEAGYDTIEDMLNAFEDHELSLFLAQDGVEGKN